MALWAGAMAVLSVSPAQARWETLTQAENAALPAADRMLNGKTIIHRDADPSVTPTALASHTETPWDYFPIPGKDHWPADGVGAYVDLNGTAKVVLKWVREGSTAATRAADNPPPFVYLALTGSASSHATSDLNGTNRDLSKESVLATVQGTEAALVSGPYQKEKSLTATRLVSISTQGMVTINGLELLKGPETTLVAKGWISGGRVKTYPNPSGGIGGSVRLAGDVGALVGLSRSEVTFTPNPNSLAVMDCLNPSKTLFNQYLIDSNIPVAIYYGGTDSNLLERLRQTTRWRLDSPPMHLADQDANGNTAVIIGGSVFPTSYIHAFGCPTVGAGPNATPAPTPFPEATPPPGLTEGLHFDRDWYGVNSLPLNNSDYGQKDFYHLVLGSDILAKVAFFYPWNNARHRGEDTPAGYVSVQSTPSIRTPNWFYYYNQAYPPPCPIRYSNDPNVEGYYTDGQSFIRVCNAHGTRQTALFRTIGGVLKVVGVETVRGIDSYARLLKHEFIHKRCYEAINTGLEANRLKDTDFDKVPDVWEKQVGLTVTPGSIKDTTGFVTFWGNSDYTAADGDSEAFARLYEEGVFVDPADPVRDWADDGLNWGAPVPPNRCARTALKGIDWMPTTSLPGTVVTTKPAL